MVGIAVATMELSTAAMNVAIRQAASTSVRRAEGACATSMAAVFGLEPLVGHWSGLVMAWDAARFCHRGRGLATCTTAALPCYPGIEPSRRRTAPRMPNPAPAVDIGVDIGGTFTDIVCRRAGEPMRTLKIPTTRGDPSEAVLNAITHLARDLGVAAQRHRALPAWHDDRHQCGAGAQGREDRADRQRGVPRHPGDRLPAPPGSAPHHAGTGHAGVPGTRRATQGGARAGLRAGRGDRAAGRGLGAARRGGTGRRRRAGDRGVLSVLLPASAARAAHARADRGGASGHRRVAVERGRSHLPRIRAHRRHRVRCVHEACRRPLSGTPGGRAARGARHAHRCRSCSRAAGLPAHPLRASGRCGCSCPVPRPA